MLELAIIFVNSSRVVYPRSRSNLDLGLLYTLQNIVEHTYQVF